VIYCDIPKGICIIHIPFGFDTCLQLKQHPKGTNPMTEKYYIVSETELRELYTAWQFDPGPHKMVAVMKAEAACRKRQLPKDAKYAILSDDTYYALTAAETPDK